MTLRARKNLGWHSLGIPPLITIVAAEIRWRYLTHGNWHQRGIATAVVIVIWLVGVASFAYTPFRSQALKWTCIPIYATLMPVAMLAIDIAIEGVDFGS